MPQTLPSVVEGAAVVLDATRTVDKESENVFLICLRHLMNVGEIFHF